MRDLIDANKNIRLINKRIGKGRGKNQETGLTWVEILKWLLRNKVNKANIDRGKIKRKQKKENHRTHPSRIEIFRLLLRN